VWDEKPGLAKMTATKQKFWSLTATGGNCEALRAGAPFCGWPGVQQSMGHWASLWPAVRLADDWG